MCGEQWGVDIEGVRRRGSSPRVRGTVTARLTIGDRHRFIPACAGNSARRIYGAYWVPVHPRVCGEQTKHGEYGNGTHGSSPRVRGTDRRCPASRSHPRFIPACAGNSRRSGAIQSIAAVHPRVCGEQLAGGRITLGIYGSSPRVRGTVSRGRRPVQAGRFIPACAGNRDQGVAQAARNSVHPRVCGEQQVAGGAPVRILGSSPRVRGTAIFVAVGGQRQRFIPACAGNRGPRVIPQ